MKKLTTKLVIGALSVLLFSCNKKRDIENIFITQKNEYWNYKDCDGGHSLYFKFNKKGDYDKYNRYIKDGFSLFNNDGDVISGPRRWSIKNDSTFVWDKGVYKIEVCAKDSIILSYNRNYENNKKCKITFKKVVDN
jgi:hypothetical protein